MASARVPGDINRNRQRLIAKTEIRGNDFAQYVWVLECQDDGHRYGANGTDFHQRLCPRCQGGRPGLSIEGYENAL